MYGGRRVEKEREKGVRVCACVGLPDWAAEREGEL